MVIYLFCSKCYTVYVVKKHSKEVLYHGKETVQGGVQAAAGPDDQLHLHPQGDLSPGDHLQRQRRLRQAVLPGPDGRFRGHEPQGLQDRDQSGQGTTDPHRQRQRHRHGQGGPGEQPGRHRLLRLLQVQAGGGGRRQGHRRHRPVRRGLLLRLHGGGPHHRGDEEVRRRHRLDVAVLRGRRLHHHRV